MDSTDFVDPYLDPTTGILRNGVGARTKVALDQAEGDLAFTRLTQLVDTRSVPATGNLIELCGIHRHLFQDLYTWAGELRTVDVRKNAAGAEPFLPVAMIQRAASFSADELKSDNMLAGMDRDQFIDRLAHHYDQFNYVHPFREGNGRAQRVFWNRIAHDAGWQLDWRHVTGSTNDHASRMASEQQDFGPLRDMFDQITTAATAGHDEAWRAAEVARHGFPRPGSDAAQEVAPVDGVPETEED